MSSLGGVCALFLFLYFWFIFGIIVYFCYKISQTTLTKNGKKFHSVCCTRRFCNKHKVFLLHKPLSPYSHFDPFGPFWRTLSPMNVSRILRDISQPQAVYESHEDNTSGACVSRRRSAGALLIDDLPQYFRKIAHSEEAPLRHPLWAEATIPARREFLAFLTFIFNWGPASLSRLENTEVWDA